MTSPPDSIIPSGSHVRTPQCPHCGFAVSKEGELCVACKEKEDAKPPKPLWELAPQPVPAYMRDGRQPREGVEDDDDDDDATEEEQ